MTATDMTRVLRKLGACEEAREWADGKDLATAWATCQRPDWMLWLLEVLDYNDDRVLRLFACWCVRQVWHLLSDERSRAAVEVAERYARGEETDDELSAASDATWVVAGDAASAAAWSAAGFAARAAASAASRAAAWDAWSAAGYAAGYAAWAATSAAAGDAARAAAWVAASTAQADRLREVVPLAEVERLMEEADTNDSR